MTITSPFNVSVVDVTINNTYSRYYINSNYQQPNLTLFRGKSYNFNLNGTVSVSPFWIKTIASIGTGNAFNTGVTGNGSQSGTITFAVPNSAPDILYYGSQNNEEMWGRIFIFDGIPSDPPESTTTIVNPIFEGTGVPLTLDTAPLQSDRWYLPTNDSNGFTFVGSGATSGIKPDGYRVTTGATINSSALYRANSSGFINFGRGSFAGGVDFSRPVWLIFKGQIAVSATAGIFRIQLGGYDGGATTVGNMTPTNTAFHGMGFEISNNTVKLETVNTQGGVATRNLSASLGAYTPYRNDLKAYSDGLGNVKVYINNVLVNTLTIGPTVSTGGIVIQLRISIENGSSTEACYFDLCNSQLSVIVE